MKSATPNKPYADFPLFAHQSGQWAKKIKGRTHYFGKWSDPQAAVAAYRAQRDYLYAGQEPPAEGATLAILLNAFRRTKSAAVENGELSQRSFDEYESVCDTIASLGKHTPIELVDFVKLRKKLCAGNNGKHLSPVSQKRLLGIARMVFNFANEELEPPLPTPIRYRKKLKLPTAKVIRRARNEVGERLFTAAEILALLGIAKPQLKAMIYLGINCGFGNADCATLPIEQIDIANGRHHYWRPKTEIARRCPLWPETTAALYAVIKNRNDGLAFITKYGNAWEGKGRCDPISYEFRKLATKLGIFRKGVTTFYTLRRTFETIAATTGDQVAVDFIMGHAPESDDMAAIYRQKTFDSQLVKVTDHVHGWLHGSITIS
ncbi:MAG: tyrosine-type recombinase/integrase [Pirellulales bacterium]